MFVELVTITADYPLGENTVKLTEMFKAPAKMVKCLGDFFTCRDDDEYFTLSNGEKVYFLDCSIKVSDSKQVVSAYDILEDACQSLNSFPILSAIMKDSEQVWANDSNLQSFSEWYKKNNIENECV